MSEDQFVEEEKNSVENEATDLAGGSGQSKQDIQGEW